MIFLIFIFSIFISPTAHAVFATEKVGNTYILVGSSTSADMQVVSAPSGDITVAMSTYVDDKGDVFSTQMGADYANCSNEYWASSTVNKFSGSSMSYAFGGASNKNTLTVECRAKGASWYYKYSQYVPPVPSKSCSVEVLSNADLMTTVGKSTRGTATARVICNPLSVRMRISITTLDTQQDVLVLNGGVRVKMSVCDGCGSTTERDVYGPYTFNPLFVVTDTGTLGQWVSGDALLKIDIL